MLKRSREIAIYDWGGGRPAGHPRAKAFSAKASGARKAAYAIVLGGVMVAVWAFYQGPSGEPVALALASFTDAPDSGAPGIPQVNQARDSSSIHDSAKIRRPGAISANGLLHELLELGENGGLVPDDLRRVPSALLDLLSLGRAAVPDIRNFLLSGDDASFNLDGESLYEYASVRLALIDLLKQIGGLEAEHALLEQLYARASVSELKAIADALDWLQPDLYSESILEVAREWLTLFSAKEAPGEHMESGPLFQVLQDYGGSDLAATLYEVPYWLRDYAQVTLASLPDGQGVAGLEQMARRDLRSSRDSRSLHLLAQAAVFQPQAEAALLALAQSDQIPDSKWPLLAEVLMGDSQLQIGDPQRSTASAGSLRGENLYSTHTIVDRQVQVIYSVHYSAVLPAQEAVARFQLISRLIDGVGNPAATDALWAARSTLADYYY